MSSASTIRIAAPAGYALAAASRFVLEFPASQGGSTDPTLDLAFALDDSWEPVGVRITEAGRSLHVRVVSNDADVSAAKIRRDIVRILSLDDGGRSDESDDRSSSGDGYAAIGRRDRVIGDLQDRHPDFRPVQFHSPYEAAAWAIIGQRIRMMQAVKIKDAIAAELGTSVSFPDGQVMHAFPAPTDLRRLGDTPGLASRRVEQLHSLAEAALAGQLDPDHLLDVPTEVAMTELQRLPGVGPFSAELILVRGAGARDVFPRAEKRLRQAMATLYSTDDPAWLEAISDGWRPYRSWVSVLIRTWAEEQNRSDS